MIRSRLVAYHPNGARIRALVAPTSWSASAPQNATSALALEYLASKPGADVLTQPVEVALEVADVGEDGTQGPWREPANSRFLRLVRDLDGVDRAGVRKYQLPGYAFLLGGIPVLPATNPSEANTDKDGKRKFLSANAGTIVRTVLQEARALDPEIVPGLDVDFTTALDSAGEPWAKILTIYYEPGLPLASIIDNLAAQGVIDWEMQGRTLRIYNPDTALARRRPQIRVHDRDSESAPVKGTLEGLRHLVLLRGDAGQTWVRDNPTAPKPWGKTVSVINQGGVRDEGTATTLIQAELNQGSAERIQYTRAVRLEESDPQPFVDYRPGDYITARDADGRWAELRVFQLGLALEGGRLKATLTLGDLFEDALIRQAKRTKGIVGGATSDGGSGSRPTPPEPEERRTPASPSGLVVTSNQYLDTGHVTRAVVTATYDPAETGLDGLAQTMTAHELFGRPVGDGAGWRLLTSVPGSDAEIAYSPLPVGEEWAFCVRAIAENGLASDWSNVVQLILAADTEPPPPPSTPLLSSRLGAVTVTWDGRTDADTRMPEDFDRVDVYQGVPADGQTVLATWQATSAQATWDTGQRNMGITMRGFAPAVPGLGPVIAYLGMSANGDLGSVARLHVDWTYQEGLRVYIATSENGGPPARNVFLADEPWMTVPFDLELRLEDDGLRVTNLTAGHSEFVELTPAERAALGTYVRSGGPWAPFQGTHDGATVWVEPEPAPAIGELRASTGSDFLVVTGLPYGEETSFYFVAVDRAGNASDPSDVAAIATVPLVDEDIIGEIIRDANIVDVDGTKIHPSTIETTRLQVGSANMVVDPLLTVPELRDRRAIAGAEIVESAGAWQIGGPAGATIWLGTDAAGANVPVWDVTAGARYILTGEFLEDDMQGSNVTLVVREQLVTGQVVQRTLPNGAGRAPGFVPFAFAFPYDAGANVARFVLGIRIDSTGGAGARVWFISPFSLRPAIGGVLIENGAVTADKIAALAITAGKIAANAITADKIDAGAVTAGKIAADAVQASQIAANAITAKHTITGALFQTSATAGVGIKIDSSGIRAFSPTTGLTMQVVASTGNVSIVGSLTTGGGAAQVVMSDQIVRNRPGIRLGTGSTAALEPVIQSIASAVDSYSAGSLVVSGREAVANSTGRAELVLKVGGDFDLVQQWGPAATNGVGISKVGQYLEVKGRHRTSAIPNNMASVLCIGSSQSTASPVWSFTYGAPAPSGSRVVTGTPTSNSTATQVMHIYAQSASGFTTSIAGAATTKYPTCQAHWY